MIPQQSTSYLCALLLYPCLSYTVSGEDACPCVTGSNCPENCTLVNIAPQAASNFTSGDNRNYTMTGQAAWVTDGVTSRSCASVSSLYPAWKAEFGQNRTVSRIKIFWEGQQGDIFVTVDGNVCHTPDSNYTWMPEYTVVCDVPVTGSNLLMHRQPTLGMLSLSLCEVEIYAITMPTTTSSSVSTTSPPVSPISVSNSATTSSTTSSTTLLDAAGTAIPMPTTTSSPVVTTSPPVSPISVSSRATTSSTTSSTTLLDAAGTAITMPTTTSSSVSTTSPPVSPISVSNSATTSSTTSSTTLLDAAGTDPGPTRDSVTSIITPILVSCVVIIVVLCVTVVITSYIRRQQGPNHQEENKNQSYRHYAGLESGRGDGDYASLNCAYEEFPNTLPDPAPSNTTDSTGHSLYANEGIESQMRDLNPDHVVYANGAVQME